MPPIVPQAPDNSRADPCQSVRSVSSVGYPPWLTDGQTKIDALPLPGLAPKECEADAGPRREHIGRQVGDVDAQSGVTRRRVVPRQPAVRAPADDRRGEDL